MESSLKTLLNMMEEREEQKCEELLGKKNISRIMFKACPLSHQFLRRCQKMGNLNIMATPPSQNSLTFKDELF